MGTAAGREQFFAGGRAIILIF